MEGDLSTLKHVLNVLCARYEFAQHVAAIVVLEENGLAETQLSFLTVRFGFLPFPNALQLSHPLVCELRQQLGVHPESGRKTLG